MGRSSRIRWAVAALGLVFAALVVSRAWIAKPAKWDLVISTGTAGGTYDRLGNQLARILQEHPGEHIGSVEARPSQGTIQSIDRLCSNPRDADVAFVIGAVLATHPCRVQIRVLVRLYEDLVQVVVRKNESMHDLDDLRGRRIYTGADLSGTRVIAEQIFATAGIGDSDYKRAPGTFQTYDDASRGLQVGRLDAAVFVASAPATAISDALASGCCELLDLTDDLEITQKTLPALKDSTISARTYPNQATAIHTLAANALLVAHEKLGNEVVVEMESAIFGAIGALAEAHIRAQDIRLEHALADLPAGIEAHPGTREFLEQEREKVLIATGTVNGKYYRVGKQIQLVLQQRGIPARVTQTGGSLENLELLNQNPRTLAIVQYDSALASYWSPKIYHTACLGNSPEIPSVRGMRHIATLHREKIHALIRRSSLAGRPPTLRALDGLTVAVGPRKSGTQVLARAIMCHYPVRPAKLVHLAVPDMVARLNGEEIDAIFFVSHVPSEALRAVLQDGRNQLLSIDPRNIAALSGPALGVAEIEPGVYGAQREGERAIDTIATWAVLVAREDFPFDVETVTSAVFEGAGFLGISESAEGMARNLPSLPIHPDARSYYEERGFLPLPWPWNVDWLTVTWRFLAILVMLIAAYQGVLTMRREATRRRFSDRIHRIPTDAAYASSASDLISVLGEVRQCGRMAPWKRGQLDQSRVSALETRIGQRIDEARQRKNRSLLAEIRRLRETGEGNGESLLERYAELEDAIWIHLENGEIDPSQHRLLQEAIRERSRDIRIGTDR